jgi:polynucleotide 5'-triphosphatase
MSLSIELPNELNDAAFEIFKKRVTMEREKERTSYIHQATFTRIDLTKVREKNNRIPKYELELEINTPALLRSMHNVMEDPLYYIDLVQAFLDNGRIITRHLSLQRQ